MARRRLLKYYLYVLYNDVAYGETVTVSPFDATGGTDQFTVVTNHNWSVASKPDWITLSVVSGGKGATQVTITASANTGDAKTENIVIQTDNGRYIVNLECTIYAPGPVPSYYFYWGNTGTATSTAVTVNSAATITSTIPFRTNYTNLTYYIVNSWITSVAINLNNKTFTANFSANPNETDRVGTVQIKSGNDVVGTITIKQLKKKPTEYTISVSPTSATSPASGRTVTLTVQSNQTWTVSKDQAWATLSTTSGSGNGTVHVTIPNYTNTESDRSVTITFTGNDGQVCTSTITQERYVPPTPTDHLIKVEDWELSFDADGGKEYITIKAVGQGWFIKPNDMPDYITLDTYSGEETSEDGVQVGVTCDENTGDTRGVEKLYVYGDGGYGDNDWFTVSQEAYVPPTPDVLTITIDNNTIAYNETTNARAYLNGTDITSDSRLVFSSDDTSVATVSNGTSTKGIVSGVASGSTNISATYNSLTSNSIQLTVTGGIIDPYDPSNWSWYDIGIVTGTTSAQTAVTQTIHVSESSQLIAIAYVRDLGVTIDVTSESVFSFRNGSGTGSISNEYFNATNAGTAEIISTYQYQVGSPVISRSYVTINVQAAPRNLYLSVEPVSSTVLQSGTTETITFKALILDHNDQSYSEDVTSDCVWSIVSGERYAETGATKGEVNLKENPASDTGGTVRAAYTPDSAATENFTILHKDEPQPVDELTGITVTIESAPDIPASGGTVECSDVTYTVTAHYSISSDRDVTDSANTNCTSVTAQSKGATVTGRTNEGTLTMEVSYSEGGITKTDTGSIGIYQEANNVERTWSETGETEVTLHNEYISGDSTYRISCDDDKTVGYQEGSIQIKVYPFMSTPWSAITYETYKETTTPFSSYTSNYVKTGNTTTGTTILSGETAVTREWIEDTMTEFDVQPGYQNWITNVVCHGGSQALGHGMADINYSEYSSGENERVGVINFYITDNTATTCTFNLTQTPRTTRDVTITFEDGQFENNSNGGHEEFTIESMNFILSYDNDNVYSYPMGEKITPQAVGVRYPFAQAKIELEFEIPLTTTSMTFEVKFTQIVGQGRQGSISGNDYSKDFSVVIDDRSSYEVGLPDVEWRNDPQNTF